ncbi:hypothetical protein NY547_11565 [Cnuibacter physcomitrellae]|nr:hypothetical protein [Cnuibacter physcomitrellae]
MDAHSTDDRDLQPRDRELIAAASALLVEAHDPGAHRVAAAAEGTSGAVYLGLSLLSPRVSICAETTAIANAKMAGEVGIRRMVAVGLDPSGAGVVINPCGVCREIVPVFGDDLEMIADLGGGRVGLVRPAELLPMPWVRARPYD